MGGRGGAREPSEAEAAHGGATNRVLAEHIALVVSPVAAYVDAALHKGILVSLAG